MTGTAFDEQQAVEDCLAKFRFLPANTAIQADEHSMIAQSVSPTGVSRVVHHTKRITRERPIVYPIPIFTLVDDFTRECLALEVDTSLSGQRASRILEALRLADRLPGTIVCDNGTEFTSKAMLKWSLDKGVKLNFIEPGKPTQNAFIESFNGKFRHECLRQHWFESLYEARNIVEDWRQDYNHVRPHSSLNYQTPKEVARQHEMIKNQPLDSHSMCSV